MPEIELGFTILLCRLHSIVREQIYIGGFNAIKREIAKAKSVRVAMDLECLQEMFAKNCPQSGWTSIDNDQKIFGLLLGYISPDYHQHYGNCSPHYLVMVENNVFCVETVDIDIVHEKTRTV